VRELKGHAGAVLTVAAGRQLIATGGADRTVRLWNAGNGQPRAGVSALTGHSGLVLATAFSPDGKALASADSDGVIRVWDAATARERVRLTGHDGAVWALAFSADGKTLASGGADRTVRLWDLSPVPGTEGYGKLLRTLEGHEEEVLAVAFAADGLLASGDGDPFAGPSAEGRPGTVRLWDAAAGKEKAVLSGHARAVRGLAFAPDGKTLASGGADRTVRLWDVSGDVPARGMTAQAVLTGPSQPVVAVAFSPDGKTLAAAAADPLGQLNGGEVRLWDAATGRLKPTLVGHRRGLSGLAFTADGKGLLAGSFDETVRWWALER
jgi:WD40 repeat protein